MKKLEKPDTQDQVTSTSKLIPILMDVDTNHNLRFYSNIIFNKNLNQFIYDLLIL